MQNKCATKARKEVRQGKLACIAGRQSNAMASFNETLEGMAAHVKALQDASKAAKKAMLVANDAVRKHVANVADLENKQLVRAHAPGPPLLWL